jgi:hypothetical protein
MTLYQNFCGLNEQKEGKKIQSDQPARNPGGAFLAKP